MILELDKETIDFLCVNKLTFNQFAICLLIHKKDVATIIRVTEEIGKMGSCLIPLGKDKYKNEMDDLIDRGYIEHNSVDKRDYYAIDNFKVNKLFTKSLDPLVSAPEEFFSLYPSKVVVNGVEYSARSCDFDEMGEKYLQAIKHSVQRHRDVISKLTAYRERNTYAQMNIMKFIGGREWENMEAQSKPKVRGY